MTDSETDGTAIPEDSGAERRNRVIQTLIEVSRIINLEMDPDRLCGLILEQLERVLDFNSASVMLYEEGVLRIVAGRGYAEPEKVVDTKFSLETNLILRNVLHVGQPIHIPDAREDSRWEWIEGATHIRSWIGAPLTWQGQQIGLLSIDHGEVGRFTEEDLRLAVAFANQAASALSSALLSGVVSQARAALGEKEEGQGSGVRLGILTPAVAGSRSSGVRAGILSEKAPTDVSQKQETILLGKILLQNRLATEAQLQECVDLQQKARGLGAVIPLGAILVGRKYLDAQVLDAALKVQMRKDRKATDSLRLSRRGLAEDCDDRIVERAVMTGLISSLEMDQVDGARTRLAEWGLPRLRTELVVDLGFLDADVAEGLVEIESFRGIPSPAVPAAAGATDRPMPLSAFALIAVIVALSYYFFWYDRGGGETGHPQGPEVSGPDSPHPQPSPPADPLPRAAPTATDATPPVPEVPRVEAPPAWDEAQALARAAAFFRDRPAATAGTVDVRGRVLSNGGQVFLDAWGRAACPDDTTLTTRFEFQGQPLAGTDRTCRVRRGCFASRSGPLPDGVHALQGVYTVIADAGGSIAVGGASRLSGFQTLSSEDGRLADADAPSRARWSFFAGTPDGEASQREDLADFDRSVASSLRDLLAAATGRYRDEIGRCRPGTDLSDWMSFYQAWDREVRQITARYGAAQNTLMAPPDVGLDEALRRSLREVGDFGRSASVELHIRAGREAPADLLGATADPESLAGVALEQLQAAEESIRGLAWASGVLHAWRLHLEILADEVEDLWASLDSALAEPGATDRFLSAGKLRGPAMLAWWKAWEGRREGLDRLDEGMLEGVLGEALHPSAPAGPRAVELLGALGRARVGAWCRRLGVSVPEGLGQTDPAVAPETETRLRATLEELRNG